MTTEFPRRTYIMSLYQPTLPSTIALDQRLVFRGATYYHANPNLLSASLLLYSFVEDNIQEDLFARL